MTNRRVARKNTNGQSGKSGSEMWGLSLEFWQSVFFWATVTAAVSGGLGVTAAFVSAIVGYQVTGRVQREADRRISETNERAAQANERAANAEQRAAEANEKAEQERLARMKIEERLAPRNLTLEQQKELVSALEQFKGQSLDICKTVDSDTEVLNMINLIGATLQNEAGWAVTVCEEQNPERAISGMVVEVDPKASEAVWTAAKALVSTPGAQNFAIAGPNPKYQGQGGILMRRSFGLPLPEGPLKLLVGKK